MNGHPTYKGQTMAKMTDIDVPIKVTLTPDVEYTRLDTAEATIQRLEDTVAELYRRLDNNQDDDRTTAQRVDDVTVRLDKQLLAIEITNETISTLVNTGDIHTRISDAIADRLEELDAAIETGIDNQDASDRFTDDILDSALQRIAGLENLEDQGTLDRVFEQINQRLTSIEARLNHIEYPPQPYTQPWDGGQTWPTYPTQPYITWNSTMETKNINETEDNCE